MTASHSQTDIHFSTCQNESPEAGQTLSVRAHFPDGSHDSETAVLGPYGDWIASEIVYEAEQRCIRVLNLRHASRLAEAQPSTAKLQE